MTIPNPQLDQAWIHTPESWLTRLDWQKVFAGLPSDSPIHVDLGAGDGGFLRERAGRLTGTRFLAVERLLGRARKISRRASRQGLTNIRVLRIEAHYAVEHLIPPGSVDSITVLFPDPWPKRRHHPNRLIQIAFLEHCMKCLKPDGWMAVKTDDPDYFRHIQRVTRSCTALKIWEDAKADALLPEHTDFENLFLQSGKTIHFLAFRPTIHGTPLIQVV